MNGINVNIDPEQVNRAVAEAIINSAIGKELERVINEEVSSLSKRYNNPIEGVVRREITKEIERLVQEKYSGQLRTMVAEQLTEQFTEDLFKKMWDSFMSRY